MNNGDGGDGSALQLSEGTSANSVTTSTSLLNQEGSLPAELAAAAAAAAAAVPVNALPQQPPLPPLLNLVPTPGSRLTYAELCHGDNLNNNRPVVIPHAAKPRRPDVTLDAALAAPLVIKTIVQHGVRRVVVSGAAWDGSGGLLEQGYRVEASADVQAQFERHVQQFNAAVYLVKAEQATHAYVLDTTSSPVELCHNTHASNWGYWVRAFVCPFKKTTTGPTKDGNDIKSIHVFEVPPPAELRQVVIKRLKRSVVDEYLENDGHENPYQEITMLRELGDNEHVLKPVELLQDETYLYIITPLGRTLAEEITSYQSRRYPHGVMSRDTAHSLFGQLLRILLYLEGRNIHHHDLKPQNLLLLEVNGHQVLLAFDFAMSVRIPLNRNDPSRQRRGPD